MADRRSGSRRAQRVLARQRRRRIRLALLAALAVVLLGAVLTVLFGDHGDDVDDGALEVTMFEFGFSGELTAPAGPIRLNATNTGQIRHDIGIRRGPISSEVEPGRSVSLDLGELAPGTYELYCDIVGHAEAGMVAPLIITEPVPSPLPSTP